MKEQIKEVEWRKGGFLLAVESPKGDMIARGLLDGDIEVNESQNFLRGDPPTPADLMLVPCPFVLDCNGINGQFACAEMDGHPLSKADALARGWKDIEFDPYALGASYLGTCPRCQVEEKSVLF